MYFIIIGRVAGSDVEVCVEQYASSRIVNVCVMVMIICMMCSGHRHCARHDIVRRTVSVEPYRNCMHHVNDMHMCSGHRCCAMLSFE